MTNQDDELTAEHKKSGAKNRLVGMRVQEVSLVDRPANLRQFLITKRATPDAEVAVTKDDATVETPVQAPNPSTDDSATETPAQPMQAQVKDSLLQSLDTAMNLLTAVSQQVKDSQVTDQESEQPVPEDIVSAIAELASMFGSIVSAFATKAPDNQAEQDVADEMLEPEPAADPAGAPPPADAADQAEAQKGDEVAKAGSKMSKERLARFKAIIRSLHGLLQEVSKPTAASAAPAPAPAPTPAAKAEVPATVALELTAELQKAAGLIEALNKKNETLASSLALAEAERERLAKGARSPNGLSFDGPGSIQKSKPVVWSFDLNKPPKT